MRRAIVALAALVLCTGSPGALGGSRAEHGATHPASVERVRARFVPGPLLAVDRTRPNGTISVPVQDQLFTATPATLAGGATDNVGVGAVHVAIRDRVAGRWLRADGSWGAAKVWLLAALASPGARSTTWSYVFAALEGSFQVTARARDTAGNVDATQPWRRFSVDLVEERAPSIVLILTDDQRWDTLWAMPNVGSLLAQRGVTFSNGFVANALCCPSRANILKGAYSHTTRVYQNEGDHGPLAAFDDSSTVATWLDDAGYRTALVGKYFNHYDETWAPYVPPGWDRWVAFATTDVGGGKYLDYGLSVDGTYRTYGSATADYSTDVLASFAEDFIRTVPADEPLYLHFAPYAPHEPATPAARHSTLFPTLSPWRPPSYDEPDVSDKPAHIQALPRFTSGDISRIDTLRRKQYRALRAVDEAVARLVQALADTGRLSTTMIVFMSDNGFHWGEHRWGKVGAENKQLPYEESIRVPFVVRYDPLVATARTDPSLVLNIDLAPTFAELAGASAPGAEGRSLLPLLATPGSAWRSDFLVEHLLTNVPTYCAIRSTQALYVRYGTGEEELYLLGTDPYELTNLAADPAYAGTVAAMRERATALCQPPPPGYSFTSTDPIGRVHHISTI
jgi:arylsulfatase A-like enzyme